MSIPATMRPLLVRGERNESDYSVVLLNPSFSEDSGQVIGALWNRLSGVGVRNRLISLDPSEIETIEPFEGSAADLEILNRELFESEVAPPVDPAELREQGRYEVNFANGQVADVQVLGFIGDSLVRVQRQDMAGNPEMAVARSGPVWRSLG